LAGVEPRRHIELKILKVELLEESSKKYRIEHGGRPDQFPVTVWFSRRLNPYERVELANHGLEVQVSDHDPMQAIVVTTSKFFRLAIDTLNAGLPAVAEDVRQARAAAEGEAEHIGALVQQINLKLNPEQ
jgi:hypothetical protein